MYTTSFLGQAAAGAAASLAGLRAQLTALTFGCALLSEAEQLRANHNIYECEDVARLTRWLVNTRRELERRAMRQEVVAIRVTAPVVNASGAVVIKATALVDMALALLGPDNETPTSIRYATTQQKEQILYALNAPHITRPQKTKALLGLNRLTTVAASLLLQLTLPPPFFDRPRQGGSCGMRRGFLGSSLMRT